MCVCGRNKYLTHINTSTIWEILIEKWYFFSNDDDDDIFFYTVKWLLKNFFWKKWRWVIYFNIFSRYLDYHEIFPETKLKCNRQTVFSPPHSPTESIQTFTVAFSSFNLSLSLSLSLLLTHSIYTQNFFSLTLFLWCVHWAVSTVCTSHKIFIYSTFSIAFFFIHFSTTTNNIQVYFDSMLILNYFFFLVHYYMGAKQNKTTTPSQNVPM